ncbi:uncharacterized protein [Onthophagus taurus]|uniref:uncharacterized protein n=1 Tax=Onthophagus taurus TaxID=166361 RepID=UPI0039BDCA6C
MATSTRKPIPEAPDSQKMDKTINQEKEVIPRFLVVKPLKGKSFEKMSPFALQKCLFGKFGGFKSIKKIAEGILMKAASIAQAKRVLSSERLGDIEVEVIPHKTLNVTKGIVYCPDLLNCTEEEIQQEMKGQGVIEVRRIKTRKAGLLVDTPNHILTFNKALSAKKGQGSILRLRSKDIYIPAPMRCFKCQRFGHTSLRCEAEQICVCGKAAHEGQPCESPLVCVNCGGPHSARSRVCPVYKKEVAIQEIKTKERLTYAEAKRKVQAMQRTPVSGVS